MDKLNEIKDQIRQAEQNFNYVDQEYIDAAIHEMNVVNEKFAEMLREKKFNKRVNEVKEHLRFMATLNGNIKNLSEEQLEQDVKKTVLAILEDDPDWLNEEW